MAAKKWYYNSRSGVIGNYDPIQEWPALHAGTGWHGPFNTKQDALNYYEQNKAANPGWKPPTDSISQGASNLTSTLASGVTSGLGLNNTEIQSWLIRIGEILLGIVLLGVGIAKLTGTTNVVSNIVKAKIP
jgi:hypothetical protein